jgi:hypothetical protein
MTVIGRLFKRGARNGASPHDAALADSLIDRLVAASDKRLALVKGYREKLRGPVGQAFRALHPAIQAIPGPSELSAEGWRADDTVRALFAHAHDTAAAFCNDGGVRDFFALHPTGDGFGLLALLQAERRVLAPALQGDTLQMEVARTTVSFTEPQILAAAADERAVREELVKRAMEYLALRALQRVATLPTQKRKLEQERALLQAELKLAKRRGAGFGSMAAPAAPGEVATLERDLEKTVHELEQVASRQLLPELLDELCNVLRHPGEHLALEPCTLALDSMNFAVTPSPRATTPRVSILNLAGRGPFAVLVARFPRAARPTENRLAEAAKYL